MTRLTTLFDRSKIGPAPVVGTPVATMNAGTATVRLAWTAVANATSYQYQIGALNPPTDGTVTTTTALYVSAAASKQQYGRVAAVVAGVTGSWSNIVSATPVALPTDPTDPATFDPAAWDYTANTGPRTAFTKVLGTPVFNEPTGSTATHAGTVVGNMTSTQVNMTTPIDLTNTAHGNDYAYVVNIEGWPAVHTDCEYNTSLNVAAMAAGATTGASLQHCRVNTMKGILPLQGSAYRLTGDLDYSEVLSYYDGVWPGEHTRPVVMARYAGGDFTNPYGTRIRYTWLHTTGQTTYGKAKYTPLHFNVSNDPTAYPLKEVGETVDFPMSNTEIVGSASPLPSTTATTSWKIGDFLPPAAGYETQHSGINGGRYQIIGRTGDPTDGTRITGAAAIGLPVTLGTDMPTWPHNNQLWTDLKGGNLTDPFISGTAILIYIGWANHQDCNQVGSSQGHVLWYRDRLENFTNSTVLITQPTTAPPVQAPDTTVNAYDPRYWPASYYTVRECLMVAANNTDGTQRSRIAYIQGGAVTDPVTGATSVLPAYGYKSSPRWVTFINCKGIDSLGQDIASGHTLYADAKGKLPVTVTTEARRYQGVLDQMTAAGKAAMTTANAGTLPTGANMTAVDSTGAFTALASALQATMRQLEYQDFINDAQTNIYIPTDGYNSTPDNITNLPVFQNRLAANIGKSWLDARSWVVWQGNTSADGLRPLHPLQQHPTANPWADTNGYYQGTA